MRKKNTYVVAGALFTVFFFIFSLFIKFNNPSGFDYRTLLKIQAFIPRSFDPYLSSLSLLGSFELGLVFILALILLRKKINGLAVMVIFLLSHLIETIGKAVLYHPGPPGQFFRYTIPFVFPSSHVRPGSSYPSGHSLRTLFLGIILFYLLSRLKSEKLKFLLYCGLFLLVAVTLISRVSLGEHWSTDVIGGSLLGIGAGLVSVHFF